MPSITYEPTLLDTREELIKTLTDLIDKDQGWVGSVGYGALANGSPTDMVPIWTMDARTSNTSAVDGTLMPDGNRHMVAKIGDYRVDIGSKFETMTPEVYAATYGG